MIFGGIETPISSTPHPLGDVADGAIAACTATDWARRAINRLTGDRMVRKRPLDFLGMRVRIGKVGLTNEAETRRCAASLAIYCLDRTPSFLAGITVTFNRGPESKATGHTFHRQEKYDV